MTNKNNSKHIRNYKHYSTLVIFFLGCFFQTVYAQDQSFESETVPSNWNTSKGTLSTSTLHYKLGAKSLKWDWNENDVLTISNLQSNGLKPSEVLGYFENMFRMWVYNTAKIGSEPLTIEFYDSTGNLQFYYDFQLNFTGWRAASASYKFEMFGNKSSSNIVAMKIKAPSSGKGTFYIDYIDYTMKRNTYRSPDYQLPFLKLDNGKHWSDIMYFQSLPKEVSEVAPTSQELEDLYSVKQKYDALILSTSPSSLKITTALNAYNALNINYIGGIITGSPLYGKDYSNSQTIAAVDQYLHVLARNYKHTSNAVSLAYFLNSVRYLLDQGYAEGSLMETIHHIGYSFRNVAKAIHLMREELIEAGLWEEAQKMVEWYTAVDIIWHPTAHESNLDDVLTRTISLLGACLYKTTDAERIQYLKGYRFYIHNWLTAYSKEGGGLKIDYTGFHHNTYYPLYTFGAYNSLSEGINLISGGVYRISAEKRDLFKKALLLARIIMSDDNFPNSLSGRSPLRSISITKSLKNLGLSEPIDEQLLKAYNYITGADSETNEFNTETPPTGFWQINYANLGSYRQDDWVVDMKGFNNYFWGTEIYKSDNRYGRYQSYGAVEVLYPGGHENSGFNINGWDWNKAPGTTTIHLPWNKLKAVKDRQDETTDSNFAASLRFGTKSEYYIDSKIEGKYGVFGMDFKQKSITVTHNSTFKFKKSIFCFGGKIICLGSNISNNDTSNSTATNLFQNSLNSVTIPIIVNNSSTTAFPYNITLSHTSSNWLIDAVNTGYYVKSGSSIVIDRKSQDSPNENGNGSFTNGYFASAFINHGTSPTNSEYEYVIIPNTDSSEMITFTTNMESSSEAFYEVIQKNKTAHIVKHNNMYGYSFFEAGFYSNSTPIKSNDVPCLVMIENLDQNLNLSIVQPDLNFAPSNGESQIKTVKLVLNGIWNLNSSNGGAINLIEGSGETILLIEAKDGLPVDIKLSSDPNSILKPIFEIKTIGESCSDKENGQIIIETVSAGNFIATIKGVIFQATYPFTKDNDLRIDSLKSGSYDLCISIVGGTFEQCYSILIQEGTSLAVNTSINSRKLSIDIQKGTAPYRIIVNDEELFQTYDSNFSVFINHGDLLQIKSDIACEGIFSKIMNLQYDVLCYPNPAKNTIHLIGNNTIEIKSVQVFDNVGRLVLKQSVGNTINVSNLLTGIYFLKIETITGEFFNKKVIIN